MTDETQQSVILIKFNEVGSAIFTTNLIGVTPYQVLVAAAQLEIMAKNQLVQMINQQAEEKEAHGLSKPNPKIMLPGQ